MKCSHCGAEVRGNDICACCGKKSKGSSPQIEVEYKDFRVSELLEIRSKDHKSPVLEPDTRDSGEQKVVRADRPAHRETEKQADPTTREERESTEREQEISAGLNESKERRSFSLTIVIVLLLLALLAGVIFFWGFLGK